MACYDTAPYTCTYDSGGAGSLPGGGSPDYSSFDTWESASDNDLAGYSGPVILDCYDSQDHNQTISVGGASNLSPTIYREIRSSSSCSIPWAGKAGTGCNIVCSGSFATMFSNTENYFRLNQLYLDATTDYSASSYGILVSAESFKILNCVVKATNSGSSTCVGLNMADGAEVLIYNTIVLDCKSSGIGCYAFGTDKTNYIVCCTICGNGGYGVSGANSSGKVVVWSCYAANNTSGDFRETNMDAPSGWNASKDATADLGGTAGDNYHNEVDLLTGGELDADYLATVETLYEAGAAGARFGRNPYNDLSSVIDFDNFLKNDAAGEAISKKDIIGYDRPTPDTADASWNVGASQYYTVAPPAAAFMFKQRQSFFTNLRR